MLPIEYSKNDNLGERKESFDYWDGGIPGTVEGGYQKDSVYAKPNSKDWFLEGDEFRYNNYKALEYFCEFDKFKDSKILDIGPGRGQETHNYLRAGGKLTVLEFASQGVGLVSNRRKIFNLDFDIIQADAVNIPLQDEKFDLVFSYGVLHHIPEIEKAIREVERVLKPGGTAKIMLYHKGYNYYVIMFLQWYILKGFFLKYKWREYLKIAMEQREGPCPVVFIYNMKEIYALFEKTKLQIISSFNDEIIEGRLVNWGLIPRWFINRYRNKLGAYCHLTLIKR